MSELSEQGRHRDGLGLIHCYCLDHTVTALQQQLSRVQEEKQFTSQWVDKLKELGFDERLLEEYRGQKMRIRTLESDLEAAQQRLTEVKESEQWLRVFYSSMNICGHHETHVPEGDNAQKCIYCHVESLQQRVGELEAALQAALRGWFDSFQRSRYRPVKSVQLLMDETEAALSPQSETKDQR